jgi:galactose mutarotase-like enzyme
MNYEGRRGVNLGTNNHTLRSGAIAATIKADGAELCSLKNADGLELLWQAGPEWPRHSPVLFPIVGRVKNDEYRHRGKPYPMKQHGFARDFRFDWVEQSATSCKLALVDNEKTRAIYPFAFRLEISYAVENADLTIGFDIINSGDENLPASVGAHPGFNWPLLPGLAKEAYALIFPDEEPAPIRRLEGGLLRARPEPSPIHGKTLALAEHLFADDAIIMDSVASTSVRYAADRGPSIDVSWQGFRELGVWSKPTGAPFVCIEPWHGYVSPAEFDGEFTDKPGLMHIAPGETRTLSYRVRVG